MKLPASFELSSGLQVVWIGTGTCVPRLDRRGPCTLVRCRGATVVVDLGLGALHGLLRHGVRHADLDALLVTHLHPDHVSELVSLLFAANYDENPRRGRLLLAGGSGLSTFLEKLSSAHGRWLEPKGYDLEVCELSPGDELRLGEALCRAGPVRHVSSSLAYRFDADGRTLVISGDTGPSPELEGFAQGADVLVLEASLPPGSTSAGHLGARQAGELAGRACVDRLVLYHFYPSSETVSPTEEASKAFDGPVTVAQDDMVMAV